MKKKTKKTTPVDDFEFHEIDKYKLDVEWVNQPRMVRYYGEKLAEAKNRVERFKTELEVVRAELCKKVRERPGRYGIEKITEGAIAEEVCLQLKDHTVQDELNSAKHDVNILQVAMQTLDHRRKALEDLVFLHSIQYFAEPRTPKGMKQRDIDDLKERRIRGVRA